MATSLANKATAAPDPNIHELVKERYGAVSQESTTPGQLNYYKTVAAAFGYGNDEIAFLEGANMGLGCGNPVATANIREGEVIVDLGSGGGMDVFLAAKKVGPTGKCIGIDMTEGMIQLAKKNAAARGVSNVEFIHSAIESIPLPTSTADCIISNCVLNLVPEQSKGAAIEEAFRILKPGGRMAISDIVARETAMPEELRKSAEAYVGCISGAVTAEHYRALLEQAGFKDIALVDTKADLNVYTQSNGSTDSTAGCCAPKVNSSGCGCGAPSSAPPNTEDPSSLSKYDLNQFVGSYKIYALKPQA